MNNSACPPAADALVPSEGNAPLAIGLVILAGFMLAGMDALGKLLMRDIAFIQVVWARYTFHALAVGLWLWLGGRRGFLKPRRPMLQWMRASTLLLVTLAMYTAIQVVPLADATAVMLFAPVLVSAFAGIFLGEKVGIRRMLAVVVGFFGVLIIVNPGAGVFQPAIILACMAAVGYAGYLIFTRVLQTSDNENATLFYSTAVGAVVLTLLVIPVWQPLDIGVWPKLVCTGLFGAAGHFLIIRAFQLAPASILSPFINSQLVAAALYSVIIFGNALTLNFLVGSALVVGSGLFVWFIEFRKARKLTRQGVVSP